MSDKPQTTKKSIWIPHAKLEPATSDPATFEICVIRADNKHGLESYGWFDEDKLLVSHNGGPCHWPVTKNILNRLLKVADDVARELNQEEADVA